ncbi:unnamed protein product, partial [Urochloa humidicola]
AAAAAVVGLAAGARRPAGRPWRAAAREVVRPPPLPLLLLPDGGAAYSLPHSKPLRFPAAAGYAGAFGNWLLFSSSGADAACFLRDPFSNATVQLPALHRVCLRNMSGEVVNDDIDYYTVHRV